MAVAEGENNRGGGRESARMFNTKYFQMYRLFSKKNKIKKVFTKIFPFFLSTRIADKLGII